MKKTVLLLTLLAVATSLLPEHARAAAGGSGFMLSVSGMKLDETYDGATVGTNETTRTLIDLKAGVMMMGGLYVGGIYDSRTDDTNGSKDERTAYGGTVGYHSGGWYVDGSLFLDSTLKLSSSSKLEKGSGFGVDVGRNFDLSSNLFLGLQVSYKSISYTQVNGAEQSNKLKSELGPMLTVGIAF